MLQNVVWECCMGYLLVGFVQLDIILHNDGQLSTCRRVRCGSVGDLTPTFSSLSLALDILRNISEPYIYLRSLGNFFDLKNKTNARSRITSTSVRLAKAIDKTLESTTIAQ